jgi:hypothetical protein
MRPLVLLGVFVTVVAMAVTPALAGSGGKSVSAAVAFTPGLTITTSTDAGAGVEFYKVTLAFADLLTVGYGVPDAFQNDPNQQTVGLCLLPPGTDDFSLATTNCRSLGDPDETRAKLQYSYRAPKAGDYLIAVGIGECVTSYTQVTYPCRLTHASSSLAEATPYVLRMTVRSYTTVSLRAPSTLRAGAQALLHGQVHGPSLAGQSVSVQARTRGAWKPLATAHAAADGSFSFRVRLATRGRAQLRVLYAGDATHQPCKAAVSVTVT